MLSDKQVKGLRKWSCTQCGIALGFVGEGIYALREGRGKVNIDVYTPSGLERQCSNCGTVNQLSATLHPRKH